MIKVIASNITSPIGRTVQENFDSVRNGASALKVMRDWNGIPGQICAGVFSEKDREELSLAGHTWLESLAIHSIKEALSQTCIDPGGSRVGFILSTTKGNIDRIEATKSQDRDYADPGITAQRIASGIGIATTPFTVCNACISGITAQIFAERMIHLGRFDTVIVCGADILSEFTVAGFSSLKALSPTPCRPFDIERLGLNLGECAATMIFTRSSADDDFNWKIVRYSLNNDAYHVSAPSPNGEGLLRAIRHTFNPDKDSEPATISLHGTATMFNDQSESMAISASGLGHIPITAYKAFFGHTLGASGILETVLTMKSIDSGILLPVEGFEEMGVSGKINVSDLTRQTDQTSFLKLISGFGGCNGAVLYSKKCAEEAPKNDSMGYEVLNRVHIKCGSTPLTEIYKKSIADNSRFYKMDTFSKLVYVTAALLVKDELPPHNPEDVSMLVFNKTSSILADRQHLATFRNSDGFYPSPSVFINTLPNVVMGELAVQYGIKGETSFIILPERDDVLIRDITDSVISDSPTRYIITGWADASAENDYEAEFELLKTQVN